MLSLSLSLSSSVVRRRRGRRDTRWLAMALSSSCGA
jgi:hypothetical protein